MKRLTQVNTHISLGQGLRVHVCWSLLLPEQSLPPPEGAGLLQNRSLVLRPLPHVTEHDDQEFHEPHPPFTAKRNRECKVSSMQF